MHRPWNTESSRTRTIYGSGTGSNDTHFDLEVNFLEYWEKRPNGKKQRFSWVTDLPINEENAMQLMRAGRARWKERNFQYPEEPRLLL